MAALNWLGFLSTPHFRRMFVGNVGIPCRVRYPNVLGENVELGANRDPPERNPQERVNHHGRGAYLQEAGPVP